MSFHARTFPRTNLSHGDSIVLSFLILVAFLWVPAISLAQEKPVGIVIAISGTVEYRMAQGEPVSKKAGGEVKNVAFEPWGKVEFQQKVFGKDEFRTLQGSRLKVMFEDKSLIALGPNSTMKVDSYLYKPGDKLRQGVINVTHGLSMYIVNKSQDNPNSSFNIVSPTGNIAARGTHGYVSSSPGITLVANQAGGVVVSNVNPNISGQQNVGSMMKTMVEAGKPPLPPQPLTNNELGAIRNMVLAPVGLLSAPSKSDGKSLIEVKEEKKDEKKDEKEKKGEEAKSGKDAGKASEAKKDEKEKKDDKGKGDDKGGDKGKASEAPAKPGEKVGVGAGKGEAPSKGFEGAPPAGFAPPVGFEGAPPIGSAPPPGVSFAGPPMADFGAMFQSAGMSFSALAPTFGGAGDFLPVNLPFDSKVMTGCSK